VGQLYRLSGPRSLTFAEAVQEIATATGRDIRYVHLSPAEYGSLLTSQGVPSEFVWLLNYLFGTVLTERNGTPTDGVRRVLGRPPRDFAEYVRETAATGVWDARPALEDIDFGSPASAWGRET
jgi:hypothetical protein